MKTKQLYIKHDDPGHGWLQVSVDELTSLGVMNAISNYSYIDRNNEYAYLEEDCDMSVFLTALNGGVSPETWEDVKNLCSIQVVHSNRDSHIRSMRSFKSNKELR